jgi:hypothetical protein
VTTGSDETTSGTSNPNPKPENPPSKENDKTAKPAKEVTTGFGVELSEVRRENLRPAVPSLSACEPFREAIELNLSRGRNAVAIWHDLVSENGFGGGYQTVRRPE